jgi:hypothetical protein
MADKHTETLSRVVNNFSEDHAGHRDAVTVFDGRYKSYRAVREKADADWMPKFHPAYVFQSVETMVANLVDPNPKWRIRVSPQMAPDERLEELRMGAQANELLLRHQLTLDHWAEKQRTFDLQGLICGITASKQSWAYREGVRRTNEYYTEPVINIFGRQIGEVNKRAEKAVKEVMRDDPTSEVVDVRHLIFQKGATSLATSERITHRVFKSFDQLKRVECQVKGGKFHEGPCTEGRYYHNVDELKGQQSIASEHYQRESDLFGVNPHKDDHEILEHWYRDGADLRVACVGDQSVLLEDRLSPFWFDHLEHPFPFVVCSGSPDLFRIPGISEVEIMQELQEMLWTIGSQRLVNLELINNAIFLVADDLEGELGDIAPGEQFLVPRPIKDSIDLWSPDVRAAQVSLEAEALLKSDMQNVTGGMPFLSGTDSSNVDQTTATGVSIVTSLAQKRLAAKRQQFVWAKSRIGEQWCALNQQYVREPRSVPVIGPDGYEAFEEVRPELLQGAFLFETEMADESMVRQERLAEAQSKFQVAMSAAPAMAAMGVPINARAFLDDVLEAYGVTDKDRYYSSTAPALPPAQAPASPGAPGGNGGITNEIAAAGPSSPSNPASMSPAAAMARLGAQSGGAANQP